MKRRPLIVAEEVIAVAGVATLSLLSLSSPHAEPASDPRQEAPLVRVAMAAPVKGIERSFTGLIEAGCRAISASGYPARSSSGLSMSDRR